MLWFVIISRIFIAIISILSDYAILDHQATGVEQYEFQYTSIYLKLILSPFYKWDSIHYVKIAMEGYQNDYQFVFYPLYPWLLSYTSYIIRQLNTYYLQLQWITTLSSQELIIIIGLLVNFICFIMSYYILKNIMLQLGYKQSYINIVCQCYALNPASIFYTTIYTESLYTMVSWLGFLLYLTKHYKIYSVVPFMLASFIRSNGSFNLIFIFIIWITKIYKHFSIINIKENISNYYLFYSFIETCLVGLGILLPTLLWNYYAYYQLCIQSKINMDFIIYEEVNVSIYNNIISIDSDTNNIICMNRNIIPKVYSYLQSKYWNIGFLNYYELKQIPNFIIALPIILISIYIINILKSKQSLVKIELLYPFIIHLYCILLIGSLYAHVQILTRLICSSSPIIYITMAEIIMNYNTYHIYYHNYLYIYLYLYIVLGILLYPNYYPWT